MGSNANIFAFKCILNTFEKYLHLKNFSHRDGVNIGNNEIQEILKVDVVPPIFYCLARYYHGEDISNNPGYLSFSHVVISLFHD